LAPLFWPVLANDAVYAELPFPRVEEVLLALSCCRRGPLYDYDYMPMKSCKT
jgi:hypothetical protein